MEAGMASPGRLWFRSPRVRLRRGVVPPRGRRREAQERHARLPVEQLVEPGVLPEVPAVPHEAAPVGARLLRILIGRGGAARHPAADDRAGAGTRGPVDRLLVLGLQRGVGDLEHVEDAHVDLVDQVGQDAGHADEAQLALLAQLAERLDHALLLELRTRGAGMHLHQIDAVRPHAAQALLHPRPDVLGREDVLEAAPLAGARRTPDDAAALAGEKELVAAPGEVGSDQLLGGPVVGCGVDQIDAGIEHLVEQALGQVRRDGAVEAGQLHGSEAESRGLEAGAAEHGRGKRGCHAATILQRARRVRCRVF
jgi:hypothetical protein